MFDEEIEYTASGSNSNSFITEEKLLVLKIFVLVLQDLNLEEHFKELRQYFIVNKNPKNNIENMHSAFDYLIKDYSNYVLSFSHFCELFKIQEEAVRERILKIIRKQKSLVHNQLVIWETLNENGWK